MKTFAVILALGATFFFPSCSPPEGEDEESASTSEDFVRGTAEDGRAWVSDGAWKLYDDGAFFHLAEDPEEKTSLSPYTDDPTQSAMRAWLGSKLGI